MPDTFIVKHNGKEVARVTGEGITPCKKIDGTAYEAKFIDDERMLKIVREGITVLVFYVSNSKTVSVEKVKCDNANVSVAERTAASGSPSIEDGTLIQPVRSGEAGGSREND